MAEAKTFSRALGREGGWSIEAYLQAGGYRAARKALGEMTPAAVLDEVKKASLRGRGGAGFPAGLKWGFVPAKTDKPKYLCVNADEGEPGTFKDRYILGHDPHLLIEGALIASFAVGIHRAFVYIRGEYENIARRLEAAVAEAVERKFLGPDVFGSGFALDLQVHRGAGSYICGEETALLESLEGKRGHPRLKPPFPASVGLFGAPTVINNVETLANIPGIIIHGAAWFTDQGLPTDGGTRLFGVSGAVARPGVYELPVGTPLRDIIFTHAGGMLPGRQLKAVIPGGLSAPVLRADEIDLPMCCDALVRAGSMLGSGAVIVIDDRTPILDVLLRVARFYAHESCGQCTHCRLGTNWIRKVVERMASGGGRPGDIDELARLASGIKGRTLCPMGDAAALPVLGLVQKFRSELEGATCRP